VLRCGCCECRQPSHVVTWTVWSGSGQMRWKLTGQ
jgi:hypothetical protein